VPDAKDSQPEIDARKLFESAPAVLRMLAQMTDSILFYQSKGWFVPPGLIQAAGDATALMFKLRKELTPPVEGVK
jgi:hypothetical protein